MRWYCFLSLCSFSCILCSVPVFNRLQKGNVSYWDIEAMSLVYALQGHVTSVRATGFLPDNVLISGAESGNICLHDCRNAQLINCINAHGKCVSGFADHSEGIYSSSWDGTVKLWDKRYWQLLH